MNDEIKEKSIPAVPTVEQTEPQKVKPVDAQRNDFRFAIDEKQKVKPVDVQRSETEKSPSQPPEITAAQLREERQRIAVNSGKTFCPECYSIAIGLGGGMRICNDCGYQF